MSLWELILALKWSNFKITPCLFVGINLSQNLKSRFTKITTLTQNAAWLHPLMHFSRHDKRVRWAVIMDHCPFHNPERISKPWLSRLPNRGTQIPYVTIWCLSLARDSLELLWSSHFYQKLLRNKNSS